MRVRPLFTLLGLLMLAILIAPKVPLAPLWRYASAALALLAALPLLRARPGGAACLLFAGMLLLGLGRARDALATPPGDLSRLAGGRAVVIGTVISAPEISASGRWHFLLAVAPPHAGRTWASVPAPPPGLGEAIELRGRVALPPQATNPGQFDFRAHLAREGVHSTLLARDWRRRSEARGLAALVAALRGAVQSATSRHLDPDDAGLMDGLLLSARARLPADLDDAFARTGTVHILSVSGLHLAALAAFLHALLSNVFPVRRTLRAFLTLGVVYLFALAAGAEPAVLRSALMLTVVLLAPLLRRDPEPLHSLAFAALVILLLEPLALFDPGTQLSFVTVAALLLWLEPLEALFFPWEPEQGWRERALRGLLAALCAGLIAHLGSAPLVAWHFYVVSLVAPLANLPIAALGEALLLAGLLAVLSGFLPVVGPLAWGLIGWGVRLLRLLALSLAAPPIAAVSCAPPPLWGLFLYYALFLGAAPYVRSFALRRRLFSPVPDGPAFRVPPRPQNAPGDVP